MSQNTKYLNQKKLHTKKIIMIVIAVLTLFLLFFLVILNSLKAKNDEKQQAIFSGTFTSIQHLLEHYGCKYKGMKDSVIDGFEVDIYAIFKYDLYNDDESNEDFYNKLINELAKFQNYISFRIIDESREEEIEIRVVCDGTKIKTIYINGIEDYFIYMDSRINLSKYKAIKEINILAQSEELVNCIQNGWSSNTQFGTRESIFQNYYIYFDEGIKTRTIDGKIYNIIFTKNYVNSVVNGFTVGTENDIIISKLGTPAFKNADESIIGYKSSDMYVFFEKDQISIYRNGQDDGYDEFFELVDKFLDDDYTLLEFMNELTYLWPDYEEYTYDENTVFLSYTNKGIDIKINYDETDGIILYNNIGINKDTINKYLEHTEFVAQLQVDNIYNTEVRRVDKEKKLNAKCDEYEEKYETEDDRNKGKIYKYYAELDSNENIQSIYFVSQNPQFVNSELIEGIGTYAWINEYCFAYSKTGKGIYYYDLKNQIKGTIVTGDEQYDIESYENGILKYDEKQINVVY